MDDTPPRSRCACGGQSLSQGGLYAIVPNFNWCCRSNFVRGVGDIALRQFRRETLPDHLDLYPAGSSRLRDIHKSTRCADSNLLSAGNRIRSTTDRTGGLHAARFPATTDPTTRCFGD